MSFRSLINELKGGDKLRGEYTESDIGNRLQFDATVQAVSDKGVIVQIRDAIDEQRAVIKPGGTIESTRGYFKLGQVQHMRKR